MSKEWQRDKKRTQNLEKEKGDDDDNKCQHVTRTFTRRKCKAKKHTEKRGRSFIFFLRSTSLFLFVSSFFDN